MKNLKDVPALSGDPQTLWPPMAALSYTVVSLQGPRVGRNDATWPLLHGQQVTALSHLLCLVCRLLPCRLVTPGAGNEGGARQEWGCGGRESLQ